MDEFLKEIERLIETGELQESVVGDVDGFLNGLEDALANKDYARAAIWVGEVMRVLDKCGSVLMQLAIARHGEEHVEAKIAAYTWAMQNRN